MVMVTWYLSYPLLSLRFSKSNLYGLNIPKTCHDYRIKCTGGRREGESTKLKSSLDAEVVQLYSVESKIPTSSHNNFNSDQWRMDFAHTCLVGNIHWLGFR